jgi:pimeloyl-ACP methyl ester carboxylesterase
MPTDAAERFEQVADQPTADDAADTAGVADAAQVAGDVADFVGDATEVVGDAAEVVDGATEVVDGAIEVVDGAIEVVADTDEVTSVPWYSGRLSYQRAGSGPAVLLIHGMAGSRETWQLAQHLLAESCDVVAVDLPGHGRSSLPNGDFSLGSLAAAMRDLLDRLGIDRATIIGHSLGGGIALQFTYQFPERCERLVLVSSGGLGREVSPFLRLLSLPGASVALSGLLVLRRSERAQKVARLFHPLAHHVLEDLPLMLTHFAALQEPTLRHSFIGTIRAVIDTRGQRVTAVDRLPLASKIPVMVIWGRRDQMIPHSHALAVAQALPHTRIEVFDEAGHYPHEHDPERFARAVARFINETESARLTSRDLLGNRLDGEAAD